MRSKSEFNYPYLCVIMENYAAKLDDDNRNTQNKILTKYAAHHNTFYK